MRIAVTGANGGLGRAFLEQAPPHHEVHGFAHADLPVEDYDAVMQTLVPLQPEAILHLAAKTRVDACEEDEAAAFRVNAVGSGNVALAARACGARLLAVSTDYVFDGTKGEPYHEFDRANPVNVYGRSKLAGEYSVRALVPESYVVRTAWVFGAGDDYVTGALRALAAGDAASGIVDLRGTPTYVHHLAARLLPVLMSERFGTFHLGGPKRLSFFELLSRAKSLGNLPGELTEQKAGDLNRPAPRPVDSSLTTLVAGEAGIPTMPPLDEALTDLLGRIRGVD
ncbi:MAG: dTDP-4-dehydrorhamnose reductase [Actinobacteria bacterium]|nr:dTDP-4-dehydrorhamnose reductase [Actinomycetota bacterium]